MTETSEDMILKGYETLEISSQALIREALKQGIEVTVIDPLDNFLLLRQGSHSEYVHNANETRLDNLASYFLMQNKQVTSSILKAAGLRVPEGSAFSSAESALAYCATHPSPVLMIKPKSTNYGLGISKVERENESQLMFGLDKAFRHDSEVIVEEFFEGQEYRFLVVKDRVEAVCKRLPAHVMGDGIHTVKSLIQQKNTDPQSLKVPKYYIQMGEREQSVLADQNLTLTSIPQKGQLVFLRYNSNVSTGGDPIDVTDETPQAYKDLAITASQCAQAYFCGVDLIIQDLSQAPNEENHCFIELNYNPALYLHRYPIQGKIRYVEKTILEALGFHLKPT